MTPFFTIVTPTLQRESLLETCRTIDEQQGVTLQHVVMVDCDTANYSMWDQIEQEYREIYWCNVPHKNGGNTCRHNAYDFAKGEYIFYLDDDNVLADHRVLADVAFALESAAKPAWGLFPINRLGLRFYCDPPKSCHVDTMNVVLRRDVARWPDTTAYGSDGVLVDDLMARGIAYAAFPDFRPIGVIPKISFCQ